VTGGGPGVPQPLGEKGAPGGGGGLYNTIINARGGTGWEGKTKGGRIGGEREGTGSGGVGLGTSTNRSVVRGEAYTSTRGFQEKGQVRVVVGKTKLEQVKADEVLSGEGNWWGKNETSI